MIKAALIDLDGFLINSEWLHFEANKIYFKRFNFIFTEDLHRQGTGKKFEKWITTVTPINKSGEEILRERNIVLYELFKTELGLIEGAEELLVLLHNNFKTALVTSSKKEYVNLVFEKTGIAKYFDLLVTGEMVIHGKPDPECYNLAAQKLGVNSDECVVFEDAPSGVLAGKNAGMKVIAVPSSFVKGEKAFQETGLALESLKDITLDKINRE